jgi:hypothetical protein
MRMNLKQMIFPCKFWEALVRTSLSSLRISGSREIVNLGVAIRAIERFPRHTKANRFKISLEQISRPSYWTIEIDINPDEVSIGAFELEAHFDGDRSILRSFYKSTSDSTPSDSRTSPLIDNHLIHTLILELSNERRWTTSIFKNGVSIL